MGSGYTARFLLINNAACLRFCFCRWVILLHCTPLPGHRHRRYRASLLRTVEQLPRRTRATMFDFLCRCLPLAFLSVPVSAHSACLPCVVYGCLGMPTPVRFLYRCLTLLSLGVHPQPERYLVIAPSAVCRSGTAFGASGYRLRRSRLATPAPVTLRRFCYPANRLVADPASYSPAPA